jgi:bifunctional UDP-N-acetylglucosamine pyrophosphorylase/glucosamine-1-phosphate N-acetyltransferase
MLWRVTSATSHSPVVVVLAAGHGTRMNSPTPKVLHPICGRPMVAWPARAALEAGAHAVVVVGGPDRALAPHLPEEIVLAVQARPRGTGDAVRCAAEHVDPARPVVVLAGDVPLITAETIACLVEAHVASGAAATMLTMRLDDPTGYGRVVRDERGDVVRVAETKRPGDATLIELAIREVNTGVLCFDGGALLEALGGLPADNAVPDTLPLLRAAGHRVAAYESTDPAVCLGVNDQVGLAGVRALAQCRIAEEHMHAGVTIVDPTRTVIDVDVRIGAGTVIEPGSQLEGRTTIGAGCHVGPHVTMRDSVLGDGATVMHSVVIGAAIPACETVGPFAHLRPAAPIDLRGPRDGRRIRQPQRERGALTGAT